MHLIAYGAVAVLAVMLAYCVGVISASRIRTRKRQTSKAGISKLVGYARGGGAGFPNRWRPVQLTVKQNETRCRFPSMFSTTVANMPALDRATKEELAAVEKFRFGAGVPMGKVVFTSVDDSKVEMILSKADAEFLHNRLLGR